MAMVFALAPTATYARGLSFNGWGLLAEIKIPEMRVTKKTTVHEVAVFVARNAGVDVDCISLSWRGGDLWGSVKAEGKVRTEGQRRAEGRVLLINHFATQNNDRLPVISFRVTGGDVTITNRCNSVGDKTWNE